MRNMWDLRPIGITYTHMSVSAGRDLKAIQPNLFILGLQTLCPEKYSDLPKVLLLS